MSTSQLARRRKKKTVEVEDRLDATPERLDRAKEAGQGAEMTTLRVRKLSDPFDLMRSTRALAPSDLRLNDVRWLIGEALRSVYNRARMDALRAMPPERLGSTGFGPRPGLPVAEAALMARDKLHAAEERVGPAAWPILKKIVIDGAGVRDCRNHVPDIVTPCRHHRSAAGGAGFARRAAGRGGAALRFTLAAQSRHKAFSLSSAPPMQSSQGSTSRGGFHVSRKVHG
jgi:hypothetical protein